MRRLLLLQLIAGLSACATATIDLKYQPPGEAPRLRIGKMPRVFVPEVEDRTSGGFTYAGMGATTSAQLTRPLTDSVFEAIKTELARLSVPLAASRDQADAILKAAVTGAGVVMRSGSSQNVPVDATISLALQLRNKTGDSLWSTEFTGKATKHTWAPGMPGAIPSDATNAALVDAMRKLGQVLDDEGVLNRVFNAAAAVARAPASAAPEGVRSDVDDLPPARSPRPHTYAVVIGVERYRENIPVAEFAASDAKLVAEYAKRVLGVPDANVALLTDEHATRGDFEKYFERWLPNHVQPGDEVYVYYSGHGAPDPAKGNAYLVPYDGDPAYIEQTGYSLDKVYAKLGKLPASRVIVAMDSCFSGAGGRSVIAKGARPLVAVAQPDIPARVTLLAASAGNQVSNGYQEKGHGLFTYYLLRGMKESGSDFKAVFDYLKPQVLAVARRDYNTDQEPQWREGR